MTGYRNREGLSDDWKADGACRDLDTALFFPERGDSMVEAKRVCAGCPVREECLEYSLDGREVFGLWGGKSERERRRLRRGRGRGRRAS